MREIWSGICPLQETVMQNITDTRLGTCNNQSYMFELKMFNTC